MELPIEAGVMKLVDLDRCHSVHRIPAADGRELVLYNVHLSAYTSDGGAHRWEQLELLRADMQAEYERANWCIAMGDFNKDSLGQSEEIFGEVLPRATPGRSRRVSGTAPPVAGGSAGRDGPPSPAAATPTPVSRGQYATVDGFVVSDNVTVGAGGGGHGFAWSDHNPVSMRFVLN